MLAHIISDENVEHSRRLTRLGAIFGLLPLIAMALVHGTALLVIAYVSLAGAVGLGVAAIRVQRTTDELAIKPAFLTFCVTTAVVGLVIVAVVQLG